MEKLGLKCTEKESEEAVKDVDKDGNDTMEWFEFFMKMGKVIKYDIPDKEILMAPWNEKQLREIMSDQEILMAAWIETRLREMLKKSNKDGNCGSPKKLTGEQKQEIKKLFDIYDEDENASITASELTKAMENLG